MASMISTDWRFRFASLKSEELSLSWRRRFCDGEDVVVVVVVVVLAMTEGSKVYVLFDANILPVRRRSVPNLSLANESEPSDSHNESTNFDSKVVKEAIYT